MTRTRRMFLFITVVTVLAISAMAGIKYAGLLGLFPDQVRAIIAEAPVKVTISSSVTKQRWMEEMARRFTQSGARTSAGQPIAVTGVSWMDHEFGTSALSADAAGWDWFSVQLDNDAVLMLYSIRTADGASAKMKGTLAWPDGSQQPLGSADFTLEPLGEWTSPRTNITYPSGWLITIPGENARLTLSPLIPDQEMDVSFVYWEGAIDVEGEWGGEPVRGRGYVELTGYGEGSGSYQR